MKNTTEEVGRQRRPHSPLPLHAIITRFGTLTLWEATRDAPEHAATIRKIEAADAERGTQTRLIWWPDGHGCVATFERGGPTPSELVDAYTLCYTTFAKAPHAGKACAGSQP